MDKASITEEWDFSVFNVLNYRVAGRGDFKVLRCPEWVNIIAVTKEHDFIFVEKYRFGAQTTTLEFPGGIVDHCVSPLISAMNELREETGFESLDWYALGSYKANPGLQNNDVHTFFCKDAFQMQRAPEADERVVLLNRDEVTLALYGEHGPLKQAFAFASLSLAFKHGHLDCFLNVL